MMQKRWRTLFPVFFSRSTDYLSPFANCTLVQTHNTLQLTPSPLRDIPIVFFLTQAVPYLRCHELLTLGAPETDKAEFPSS